VEKLTSVYAFESGRFDREAWHQIIEDFADSSLYQTWSYDALRRRPNEVHHGILRDGLRIVAAAQVRVIRLPLIRTGFAYVRWGPLWKIKQEDAKPEVFRQVIRALRNEYALRRRMVLRVYPGVYQDEDPALRSVFLEEGYREHEQETEDRTLLLDIRPSAEDLRKNFHQKWRNCLNHAEKNRLEVIEGEDDEIFGEFVRLYQEMLGRKKFAAQADIHRFRTIQRDLPQGWKMRVFLSRSEKGIGAGAICSASGDRGLYLFGATNEVGYADKGSYLLQWRIIHWLKAKGCVLYDLNGINPGQNPGTYRFKSGIAGKNERDVLMLGQYDSCATMRGRLMSTGEARLLPIVRRLSRIKDKIVG